MNRNEKLEVFFIHMVKILGHRGNPAEYPDNSLLGIESATRICDGVEVDFRRCGTGELVLAHDPEVDGHIIVETSLEALQSLGLVPARDLFAADFDGDLDLEVKNWPFDPGFEPDFGIGFEVADAARARDIVTSFHWQTVDAIKASDPSVTTGLLFEGSVAWEAAIVHARDNDHAVIAPHHVLVDAALVGAAHAVGLEVATWTADERSEIDRLVELGVDTIITNRPALVVEWIEKGQP